MAHRNGNVQAINNQPREVYRQERNVYRLEGVIASGAFGRVHRATSLCDNRQVAIKSSIKTDRRSVKKFQQEGKIHAQLSHRNIVAFKELCVEYCWQHIPMYSIVLEWCDYDLGRILKTLKKYGKHISLSNKRCIMWQLLSGLDFMHSKMILHRDLKPDNLLVTNSGLVKIADLGLARRCLPPPSQHGGGYNQQQMTAHGGTFSYFTPERILGARYYGKAVDMWCTGIIFAELHLRHSMFRGHNGQSLINEITTARGAFADQYRDYIRLPWANKYTFPRPWHNGRLRRMMQQSRSDTSDEALNLMGWLLALDPRRRTYTERAMAHAFFSNSPSIMPHIMATLEKVRAYM